MELSGNEYAKVATRVKEFRADHPNGSIKTTPHFLEDGIVHFEAYILMDKGEASSADATGNSYGTNKNVKAFEKLETIAVGRALAMLGYAADGEIASSEEMEEYMDYKAGKLEETVMLMRERLEGTSSLDELRDAWKTVPPEVMKVLEELKEELKQKFSVAPAPVDAPKPTARKRAALPTPEPTEEPGTLPV